MRDISVVKDFFSGRVLNLSRENAKIILNVTNLPQSLRTDDRLKITFACRALNMEDNFWLKKEGENLFFSDVNLRKNSLSEKSYDIAILGHHISATVDELRSDLSSAGMFPKFWKRENGKVFLWKTDKFRGANSIAEIRTSEMINRTHAGDAVNYFLVEKDGLKFSVSECITTDQKSLIHAQDGIDYCNHNNLSFHEYLSDLFGKEYWITKFSNMCVYDYVFANTDRHSENWGFFVNENNKIREMAPLYDFNQCLLADEFGTDIDSLIYEPTGLTFKETIEKYGCYRSIDFSGVNLSKECKKRWKKV